MAEETAEAVRFALSTPRNGAKNSSSPVPREDDLRQVVTKLVELAKGGDLAAIRELLDRTMGKPVVAVAMAADVAGNTARVTIVEDPGWYGNDAHTPAKTMRP